MRSWDTNEDELELARIMISKLALKVGDALRKDSLEFEPKTISIFVGPNNSGKTLALRELYQYLNGNDEPGRILSDVEIIYPHEPPFLEGLMKRFEKPHARGDTRNGAFWFSKPLIGPPNPQLSNEGWFQSRDILGWLTRINETTGSIMRNQVFRHYTLRLDCESRFQLTKSTRRGDPDRPNNHLASLAIDNKRRKDVRDICIDAFPNMYFALNSTISDEISISLSALEPSENHEKSYLEEALLYHAKALPIEEAGDGIRSFVGLIVALMVLDCKFVIIDDPEAFLHPPIAKKLGLVLARIAKARNMQIFITTHSWEFISGCIEATKDISIVRLTYDSPSNIASAKLIDPETLTSISRHPLLRSAQPLTALFHKTAVVTEGASDRVVYSEIARRLDDSQDVEIFPDNVFLTTHSVSRIPHVLGPLRRIGIPIAAILDIDQLRQSDGIWSNFETACSLTQEIQKFREECRNEISKVIGKSKTNNKSFKQRGLAYLEEQNKDLANKVSKLIDKIAEYGIFIVPCGCLESWFPEIESNKEDWLEGWFNAYGAAKDDDNYCTPKSEGVWIFMERLAKWFQGIS